MLTLNDGKKTLPLNNDLPVPSLIYPENTFFLAFFNSCSDLWRQKHGFQGVILRTSWYSSMICSPLNNKIQNMSFSLVFNSCSDLDCYDHFFLSHFFQDVLLDKCQHSPRPSNRYLPNITVFLKDFLKDIWIISWHNLDTLYVQLLPIQSQNNLPSVPVKALAPKHSPRLPRHGVMLMTLPALSISMAVWQFITFCLAYSAAKVCLHQTIWRRPPIALVNDERHHLRHNLTQVAPCVSCIFLLQGTLSHSWVLAASHCHDLKS